MPGDVSVEQDQDDQGDEEEDRDHEDEVELGPKILDLGLADGRVRIEGVLDHGHHRGCQAEREDPGDDAGQAGWNFKRRMFFFHILFSNSALISVQQKTLLGFFADHFMSWRDQRDDMSLGMI